MKSDLYLLSKHKEAKVNSLSFYLMEFCDAGPTPELYGPCSKRYAEDADPLSL